MHKLSPRYLNDDWHGLDEKIRDYLDTNYFRGLANLQTSNHKLLIVFSGGNAVGKTTLARRIEKELGGLVIENDEIKRCLLNYKPDIDRRLLNKLTWQYSMDLYSRLGELTPNGLIVRDGVIDWYFDRILPVFEKAGYELFIIAFDVSPQKAKELILARGDTPTVEADRLIEQLEDHAIHTKRFRSMYHPNIILDDAHLFDHQAILNQLKLHISRLK